VQKRADCEGRHGVILKDRQKAEETKLNINLSSKKSQKQNGLLVFISLRWKKSNRKRRQREAAALHVRSIVTFK